MKNYRYIIGVLLTVLLAGCHGGKEKFSDRPESVTAKELMQGVWVDEETEEVFFRMKGDSVYFPDTMSQTAYFKVVEDSLYIGKGASYHIEKQTEHLLWFKNQNGETVKLEKTDEEEIEKAFVEAPKPKIQALTEVLKRDSVVFVNGQRYHWYIAINPTKYKIHKTTYNEEGMQVDHVYYDNIVHVSVFQGSEQVFSSDLRKDIYQNRVPKGFLEQAILNNMEFDHADDEGFHFHATLCQPDAASCYVVETIVTTAGTMSTKLLEY